MVDETLKPCPFCGSDKSTAAREAYEADVRRRPTYHDGTPRKPWGDLSEIAQWSWGRPKQGGEA